MNTIRENILEIRARMDAAARAAGRDPGEILLCAASKMNDAERVHEAVEGGVDCCGENRVQELTEKLPKGAYTGKPVHFIGHLQTNKVNKVVGAVDTPNCRSVQPKALARTRTSSIIWVPMPWLRRASSTQT